jgi:hypothetical protein
MGVAILVPDMVARRHVWSFSWPELLADWMLSPAHENGRVREVNPRREGKAFEARRYLVLREAS